MKKHIFLGVVLMLTGFFFIPSKTFAFQHAYESKSDFIYALARNELPVYYSDYSNDLKTVLPKYTGVKVIGSSGSWYEIQYASKKGGTKNGWVTRDEFHSDCLIYDGREKQPFSNGTYQLSFYEENSSDSSFAMNTASIISENFSCSFKYAGDNRYTIRKAGEEKYLKADTLSNTPSSNELWGSKQEAGTFLITRKKDYYTICDETTKRNLSQNDGSILEFTTDSNAVWRLTRNKKAIEKENLQVFVQFDPVWAKHHYGNETTKDTDTNNFCTSGCGIFATVNAIYSLSGHFPDPYELAQYASDKHYRIEDCGTDSGFFKAAAEKFGYKYGFSYDPQLDAFICPKGVPLTYHRLNCSKSTGKYLRCYQVEGDACMRCPKRPSCFDKAGIRRRVLASSCYPAFFRGHQRVGTPEYLAMMRLRKIWAEGSFSVLKREHCISRIRKRGILAATEECLLAAMALNLKRMAKYHLSLSPNLLFCWNHCGFQQNFCFCQQVSYFTLSNNLVWLPL